MKKKILMILLGSMMMIPVCVKAQENGGGYGGDEGKDTHRSPTVKPKVYIAYGNSSITAYVCFLSNVDNAEISVCIDGEEVDRLKISAETGAQIPLYLPIYGTGELTIYVRRGTTLLAYYSTSI